MSDNIAITPGIGTSVGCDDIGGTQYQRVKSIYGADGVNSGDVEIVNPFPVGQGAGRASPFMCGQFLTSASGHTLIFAGSGVTFLRIYSLFLHIGGDTTLVIEDSDHNAFTGAMAMKSGNIINLHNMGYSHFPVPAGKGLALLLGSAVTVGGWILYTQIP